MDKIINSRISQHQTLIVEEEIIIKVRKEKDKQKVNGIEIRKEQLI